MKLLLGLISLVGIVVGGDNDLENVFNEANDRFTAKFFGEVAKENPGKSVVLSAYSVLFPLALLSSGAEGESHDELLSNIYIPNDNVTKAVFPLVTNQSRAAKGVTFKSANRIYVAEGYQVDDKFGAVSRDAFGADTKNADFTQNVETAKAINTWVEDQTNNRIKDLVNPDSLDSDTRAVLVNAIYFKGLWKNKFDSADTTDLPFHVTKDNSVLVPTMHRKDDYDYGESNELDAKILRLFYEGDEVSFVVILPNDLSRLSTLVEKINKPSTLSKALKSTYNVEVDVYIPKFKIETTTNLKEVLPKIGIKKIFEPAQARLTKILKNSYEPLYVSDAIQKAFIEVNEEGAEAAAANAFKIVPYSETPPNERLIFKADHPFIFLLLENDRVLFNGIYQA